MAASGPGPRAAAGREARVAGERRRKAPPVRERRLAVLEQELESQSEELAAARGLVEVEQSRYKELFELAPDAYLVTDASGRVMEANHAAATLLGRSHELLIGRGVASLVQAEERGAFRRWFRELADARGVLETETRITSRTGGRDVSISIAPMRGPGALVGFRWIVRDITAHKQAELELRTLTVELEERASSRTGELEEERARLDAIVEQMPAGLVIANADGEAVFMNRFAEKLLENLRRTDEAAFHRRYPAFRLNGEPYPQTERPATRALRNGETTNAERVYFEAEDGSRVLFEISAAPIRDSVGNITAAALTFHDLSERDAREEGEREFVANAAHELRTPIAAVLAAIEVLQAGAKETPEDRDLFLGHIEREAGRLGRLAHALLVLARAQSAGDSIKPQIVELGPLLTDVAQTLETHRDVELLVACPNELRIWSNPDLLEQAISSLAGNAAAHTSVGRVTLAAHVVGSTVVIEVRDTGRGVEAADRERIFERFYRANGAGREGFGLGLAIVRQAAEALAAEVEVDSEVGVGTTVRLRLPAKLLA
jgi:PAS domain S-box-containing protein